LFPFTGLTIASAEGGEGNFRDWVKALLKQKAIKSVIIHFLAVPILEYFEKMIDQIIFFYLEMK